MLAARSACRGERADGGSQTAEAGGNSALRNVRQGGGVSSSGGGGEISGIARGRSVSSVPNTSVAGRNRRPDQGAPNMAHLRRFSHLDFLRALWRRRRKELGALGGRPAQPWDEALRGGIPGPREGCLLWQRNRVMRQRLVREENGFNVILTAGSMTALCAVACD